MSDLRLHVPDEPVTELESWRRRLAAGATIDEVILGVDSVASWFWQRWRSLAHVGVDEAAFRAIVEGYAREIGLWLRGERPHKAVASGLAGRVTRRVPPEGAHDGTAPVAAGSRELVGAR